MNDATIPEAALLRQFDSCAMQDMIRLMLLDHMDSSNSIHTKSGSFLFSVVDII